MKNNNLIAGGSQSAAQRRENGRRGGVASGAARRMKATVQQLLAMKTQRGRAANLAAASFDDLEEVNLTVAQRIAVVMVQKALAGDVRAATWLRDTGGEKPIAEAVIETHGDTELEAEVQQLRQDLNEALDYMTEAQLRMIINGTEEEKAEFKRKIKKADDAARAESVAANAVKSGSGKSYVFGGGK